MFTEIDYPHWDRKDIFEQFYGYTYHLTINIDITTFIATLKGKEIKFYPAICYCIAKVVNENKEYRWGKLEGKVGYWEQAVPHYTVLRKNTDHLFSHKITMYQEKFASFYSSFLSDKEKAEQGNRLYFDGSPPLHSLHISTLPHTTQQALSYSKPASFTSYGTDNTSFIPFVVVGRYFEQNGSVLLPVTVEFHHAVNDGYHAETFFQLLGRCCESFRG